MSFDLGKLIRRFELGPIRPEDIDDLYIERKISSGTIESLIEDDLRQRRHTRILLVSGRGSGKTCLNNFLFSRLKGRTDILPVVVSRAEAPRNVHEVLVDILAEVEKLCKKGVLQYKGTKNLDDLLKRHRRNEIIVDNLRDIFANSPGVDRIVFIVDELDKGNRSNSSRILLELDESVSSIGQNVDLFATIAPVTLDHYLESALRPKFYRINVPPIDRDRIIEVVNKRINPKGMPATEHIQYCDVIDEDALDLVSELSFGIMRRVIHIFGQSLDYAARSGMSRITKAVVDGVLSERINSARSLFGGATKEQRNLLQEVMAKNWPNVVSKDEMLENLIDKLDLVLETTDPSRPFVISPELERVIALQSLSGRRKIERSEVAKIRSDSDLYLGQKLHDGEPFAFGLTDVTRGILVFGGSGTGKTVLLKTITEEIAVRGPNVIVFDVKGDLTELAFEVSKLHKDRLSHYGMDENDARDFRQKVKVDVFFVGPESRNRLVLEPLVPSLIGLFGGSNRNGQEHVEAVAERIVSLLDLDVRKPSARVLIQVLLRYLSESSQPRTLSELARLAMNPPRQVKAVSSEKTFTVDELVTTDIRKRVRGSILRLLAGTDGCLFENGANVFKLDDLITFGENEPRIRVIRLSRLSDRQQGVVLAWVLQWLYFNMKDLGGSQEKPVLVLCFDEVRDLIRAVPSVEQELGKLAARGRSFGVGCLLGTQAQSDISSTTASLFHVHLQPLSEPGHFELLRRGHQRTEFVARWPLTRVGIEVTENDLDSLVIVRDSS